MPKRIQLQRTKGWRKPANTVKVDRTTVYGNPIPVGGTLRVQAGGDMLEAELTAAIAVELFREYLTGALKSNPLFLDELRGKNLACWCAIGTPCHADVLLQFANT